MTQSHEKLLIATLAGLIITGAAAFAIQPALAINSAAAAPAMVSGANVWVEHCMTFVDKTGWCLVQDGTSQRWVNADQLNLLYVQS
jgi:hypothetical protein